MRSRFPLLVVVGAALGCKSPDSRPGGSGGAEASVAAVPVTSPEAAPADPRFASPIAAALTGGGWVAVAARERGSERMTLARVPAPAADGTLRARYRPVALTEPAGALRLYPMGAGLALVATGGTDAGVGPRLVTSQSDEAVTQARAAALGDASCATQDGLATLTRSGAGWKLSVLPMPAPAASIDAPPLAGGSDVVLVCGQHRVFVVSTAEEVTTASGWKPGDAGVSTVTVPKLRGAGEERPAATAAGDALVLAKLLGSTGIALWSWAVDVKPSGWATAPLKIEGDATIEAIEANETSVGVVLTREVEAAKGCPAGSDATDTFAEAGIVGRADGKLVRALERLETWKCGAEAGPFWTGWADGKLAVAWPRGADAACSRAGVRLGGVGWALVDPGGSRAKTGRAGRPAEALAEAGCDGKRCYFAAVTRGTDACATVDAPEAGRLELFAYP